MVSYLNKTPNKKGLKRGSCSSQSANLRSLTVCQIECQLLLLIGTKKPSPVSIETAWIVRNGELAASTAIKVDRLATHNITTSQPIAERLLHIDYRLHNALLGILDLLHPYRTSPQNPAFLTPSPLVPPMTSLLL